MRTTIRLDEQLLNKAKQYALAHETTFTAVVEAALREKLMKRTTNQKQANIRLTTAGGNGVYPGIDLDDSTALLDAMEK